jgi:hypothetical protein
MHVKTTLVAASDDKRHTEVAPVASAFVPSLDSSGEPCPQNQGGADLAPAVVATQEEPERPGSTSTKPETTPKLRILFLDDDPVRAQLFLVRHPDAVWVQTASDCIGLLSQAWDQVHLDHDLCGERFVDSSRSDCGMEVVRWLCGAFQELHRDTQFVVHSHNSDAAEMMVWSLYEAGYHAAYRPFTVDLVDWLSFEDSTTPWWTRSRRRKWLAILAWARRLLEALGSRFGP